MWGTRDIMAQGAFWMWNHGIVWGGRDLRDFKDHPIPMAGTSSTAPGCSKPQFHPSPSASSREEFLPNIQCKGGMMMLWENKNARNGREFQGKPPQHPGQEYFGEYWLLTPPFPLFLSHREKHMEFYPTYFNQQIPAANPRKCLHSIPSLIPFFSGSETNTGCLRASKFSPWAQQMGKGQGEVSPKEVGSRSLIPVSRIVLGSRFSLWIPEPAQEPA